MKALLRLLTLLVALPVLCSACASSAGGPSQLGRPVVPGAVVTYPSPPSEPRIQLLAAISDEGDVREGSRGGSPLGMPYGIDAAAGRIYACLPSRGAVAVVDVLERSLRQVRPRGQGALRSPANCAVDPATGDLYVADSRRGDVVVLDSLGGFIRNLQVPGGRAGDVVVRGDSVWVSDVTLGKISVYEKQSGAEARAIPEYGRSTELGLAQPLNFDVTDDAVVVSDFGGFRVQVYSHSGEHIRTIGSQGRGYGQFIRNKGVAVDRGGAIYVVDAAFNNVQIFNREGQLLTYLDGLVLPAGVAISYDPVLVDAFSIHAMEGRAIEYLIFVVSQYGPNQLTVYGFLEASGEAVGS